MAYSALANTTNDLVEETRSYSDNFVVARYVPYSSEKYNPCSCISYAKWKLGLPQSVYWGNAWEIKSTSSQPYVGGLVITEEAKGHIGVVLGVNDGSVTITEANFVKCQVTERTIRIDSPFIKGFR